MNNLDEHNESDGVRIATIYGPVGFIVQAHDELPQVKLQNQWREVASNLNLAIMQEKTFIGPDGIARTMSADVTQEELETLDTALTDSSHGDLYLVPCQNHAVS